MVIISQHYINMKHYKYIAIILCLSLLSSCLKKGLPEFESWDLNNIDNIYVEHRYESSKTLNGQPVIAYQRLNVLRTVDEANGIINLEIAVPPASGDFTTAIRDQVTQDYLWMYMDISTAAKVAPLQASPKLGDPIDLTKDHQYQVTAANGTSKVWTIKVVSFQK